MPRIVASTLAVLVVISAFAAPAVSQTISYVSLDAKVGSGLQTGTITARLSTDQHGGITVRIETPDTSLALVTADELTPGAAFVDIFVTNGSTDATFYVQALEDTTGMVELIASATGFANGVDSLEVVQPALRITGLGASHDPFDPDDPFYIQVGVPNGTFTTVSPAQKVRVGGPGLTATISNSSASTAELVTTALTAQVITVAIAPGESNSPTSVATGGVAFDGLAQGMTDVEATIPGFLQLSGNPQTVTVTEPIVTMNSFPLDIGAGLQEDNLQVRVSGTQHGGVTMHLESSDSNLVLFAPGRYDAGTPTLDVFIPNGSLYTTFYMQALEDTAGVAVVTATVTGFTSGLSTVNVLQPYFRLTGLTASIDTLDPTDPFYIQVGLPNGSMTSISPGQQARGGGAGLSFVVTSSDEAVGLLETTSTLDDSATVFIAPGESNSPTTLGTGGVAFDGVGAGITTVTAAAPGFVPVAAGSIDVTVTQPTLNLANFPSSGLGAGLQTTIAQRVNLSASQHGGVTVHIEAADTNLALVTDVAGNVGTDAVDIFVANGSTQVQYFVQGKEDTTGVIHITATAPGFVSDVDSVDLVQPEIRITNTISLTQDTLDPPDPFTVQVGVSSGANFFAQDVRAGSQVIVTATVDDSLVAEVLTLADTSHTVTVTVDALDTSTPSSVAAGGVAFNGLSPGVVDLSVSAPGFAPFSSATKTITVTSPTASMSALGTVGAGLQTPGRTISLSASQHGGVTAHVEALEPQLALVSEGASTPGQTSVDIFIADGSTSASFYVHGVDDTTGTATFVLTVPGFTGESDSVDVEMPGVEIVGLLGSIDAADPPDNFYVRVGLPTSDNSDVNVYQTRRAGQPPLVVTLISSNGVAAEFVKTSENDDTVTVSIVEGTSNSPTTVASGGAALDGLASGQTVVTAAIPGFVTVGTGQRVVDVSNQNIFINGLAARLGKDLQSVAASAELGEPFHGGTTVRIEVDDTTRAVISANALVAGGEYIDVPLSNGDAEAVFYLQALDTGQVNVTATANTFNTVMQAVDIVPAGIEIVMLADTMAVTDPDDEFVVQVGAIKPDSSGIEEPQELRGGGPSRTLTVASSNPNLAFIVIGNNLDASVDITLDPGEFETVSPVASGGLALTPWNVGDVVISASTPGFVTTAAGMPTVTITGTPTGVGGTPVVFSLEQNIPNPFNPTTTINFTIPAAAQVELIVYDVGGRRVATLVNEVLPAGPASVQWQGDDHRGQRVASGVYFYRLRAGSNVETRKMVLLK